MKRNTDALIDLVLGLKIALQASNMAMVYAESFIEKEEKQAPNSERYARSWLMKIRKRQCRAAAILAKYTGRPPEDCLRRVQCALLLRTLLTPEKPSITAREQATGRCGAMRRRVCLHHPEIRAARRGVCQRCYKAYCADVKDGQTTWKALEEYRLVLPRTYCRPGWDGQGLRIKAGPGST
jgi:hypothetical protein